MRGQPYLWHMPRPNHLAANPDIECLAASSVPRVEEMRCAEIRRGQEVKDSARYLDDPNVQNDRQCGDADTRSLNENGI